jgi:isopentenyldiphosphate isomerase
MRPFLFGKHVKIQCVKDLQNTIGLLAKITLHLVKHILLQARSCWLFA